ncbi:unnamed protein product [Rhodiola kirilowii]
MKSARLFCLIKAHLFLDGNVTGKPLVLNNEVVPKGAPALPCDTRNIRNKRAMLSLRKDPTEASRPPVLRQLFVTVSPKLVLAVKQHVSHLKRSACSRNF